METVLPRDVQRTFDAVLSVLGEAFPFATLIDFTELSRGKPLRIEHDTMPVAIAWYCLALHDVDLICTRRGLDVILTCTVCLHEISHLLLCHIPLLSGGPSTPSYAAFLRCRNLQKALYRSHTNLYDVPQEYAAETLATLLLNCLRREKTSIPLIARHLHGGSSNRLQLLPWLVH